MDGVKKFDPNEALYERGIAYGASDVRTDTMTFRFKGETFTFPLLKAYEIARYNGYFYQASIDDVRRLEAESAGAPASG